LPFTTTCNGNGEWGGATTTTATAMTKARGGGGGGGGGCDGGVVGVGVHLLGGNAKKKKWGMTKIATITMMTKRTMA
jgi:hypothetical protein